MHTYKAELDNGVVIEQDRTSLGKSFLNAAIAFAFQHACEELHAGEHITANIYRDNDLIAAVGLYVHSDAGRVWANVVLLSISSRANTATIRHMTIAD